MSSNQLEPNQQQQQSGNQRDRSRDITTKTTSLSTPVTQLSSTIAKDELINQLFQQCQNGNINEMKIIIQQLQEQYHYTVNINTVSKSSSNSLFHTAILSNSPPTIDFILQQYNLNQDEKINFFSENHIGFNTLQFCIDHKTYESLFHIMLHYDLRAITSDKLIDQSVEVIKYLIQNQRLNDLQQFIQHQQQQQYYEFSDIKEELYNQLHFVVVSLRNRELLDYIISLGTLVDDDGYEGEHSLLFQCAKSSNWEMVRYLIDVHNADVQLRSYNWLNHSLPDFIIDFGSCYSLLHCVIEDTNLTTNEKIELIDYLIEHGVDDVDGDISSLSFAAHKGQLEIVQHLIEQHDYDIHTTAGQFTLLHFATSSKNLKLVQYLINGFDFPINGKKNAELLWWSPLGLAARYSTLEMVQYLVEQKATVWIEGNTTIFCNAIENEIENEDHSIFEYLIQNCIDDDATKSVIIISCLFHSITNPSHSFTNTKLLLEKYNANRLAKDGCGFTIFHYIAAFRIDIYSYKEIFDDQDIENFIRYLQPTPNEINSNDNKGQTTPLFYALSKYSSIPLSRVQLLVEFGANIHHIDSNGHTIIYKLNEYSYASELLPYFIQAGIDINHQDNNGQTALHCFAEQSKKSLLQVLVENNATVDALDNDGNTPFLLSAKNNYTLSEILITNGANIHHINNNNENAVHIAVKSSCEDIIPRLSELSIDFNIKNCDGNTPLTVALLSNRIGARSSYYSCYDEIIKALLQHKASPIQPFEKQLPLLHYLQFYHEELLMEEVLSTIIDHILND